MGHVLWIEYNAEWDGLIGGCSSCNYAVGPWLSEPQMIAHLGEHWRSQHGALGGPAPRVFDLDARPEDDLPRCTSPGCSHPRAYRNGLCRAHRAQAYRAERLAA